MLFLANVQQTPRKSSIYYYREVACLTIDGRNCDVITITDHNGLTGEREPRICGLFPDESRPRPHKYFVLNVFITILIKHKLLIKQIGTVIKLYFFSFLITLFHHHKNSWNTWNKKKTQKLTLFSVDFSDGVFNRTLKNYWGLKIF